MGWTEKEREPGEWWLGEKARMDPLDPCHDRLRVARSENSEPRMMRCTWFQRKILCIVRHVVRLGCEVPYSILYCVLDQLAPDGDHEKKTI
jgi:hypothetical protein